MSNHSAVAKNFGSSNNLSIVFRNIGQSLNFKDDPNTRVVEAVFDERYLDNNPDKLQNLISDVAKFIVTGQYTDTAGAKYYNLSGNVTGDPVNGMFASAYTLSDIAEGYTPRETVNDLRDIFGNNHQTSDADAHYMELASRYSEGTATETEVQELQGMVSGAIEANNAEVFAATDVPAYRIRRDVFYAAFYRCLSEAGIQTEEDHTLTPVACRHTFVTRLTKKGIPIAMIQKAARHTSYKTTQGYTHLDINDVLQALNS